MKSITIIILKIVAVTIGALFIFSIIYFVGIILIAALSALITAIIACIYFFVKEREFKQGDKVFIKDDSNKSKFLNSEFNDLSNEDQEIVEKLLNKNITQSILNAMDRHTVDYCRRLDKS